ncbi:hypothetical protein L0B70_08555 [Kaistella sp. 97-N-M2]|uniref:hypothetical protein n=1 Tax=Kaistella sp. 97-N-M2 TaxID=2908645 RepID=UPI001F179748|nr:hypothetical protein [Kaistella sp. 97-N-M2]UJF28909.1 hypothetical protein L0B70_08555 [Kaistella sp. 97-N-M2]
MKIENLQNCTTENQLLIFLKNWSYVFRSMVSRVFLGFLQPEDWEFQAQKSF